MKNKERFKKILAFASRVGENIPLTWQGLALGLFCAALLWWPAFRKIDYIALVVGAAGLVLLTIDFVLVALATLTLRDALRRGETMHGVTGLSTIETAKFSRTGFSLPALQWFPLIEWWWSWLEPQSAETRWLHIGNRRAEAISLQRRQRIRSVKRKLVIQDVFGLVSLALRDQRELDWVVLPHRAAIGKYQPVAAWIVGELWSHPSGKAEGDYVDLRRYIAGDPARLIHWKVFGRTRRLMVRTQEQAKSPAERTFAYLIAAGISDEPSSAVARAVIEDKVLGNDWRFAVDGEASSTNEETAALRMIAASSSYTGEPGSGLSKFAEQAQQQGPAHLLVFAPYQAGSWVDTLQRVTSSTGHELHVVIGVDGVRRKQQDSAWRDRFFSSTKKNLADYEALQALVRQLGKIRCVVSVVDRSSGRVVRSGESLALASAKAA